MRQEIIDKVASLIKTGQVQEDDKTKLNLFHTEIFGAPYPGYSNGCNNCVRTVCYKLWEEIQRYMASPEYINSLSKPKLKK